MIRSHVYRPLVGAAAACMLIGAGLAPMQAEAFQKQEIKCLARLSRSVIKVHKTYFRKMARCKDRALKDATITTCPTSRDNNRIQIVYDKLVGAAEKYCASNCSSSTFLRCIGDAFCPPDGSNPELCSGGVSSNRFNYRNIGFPGILCETPAVLGHAITSAEDIGACSGTLALQAGQQFAQSIYGSIGAGTSLNKEARRCLKSIALSSLRLTDTAAKAIFACRNRINSGAQSGDPDNCATSDAKAVSKIASASARLAVEVQARCTNQDIGMLEVCNGEAATVNDARLCLTAGALEVADSAEQALDRKFSTVALREAVYPPEPVCGDGRRNQNPKPHLLLGEECDGDDDALCPGRCLPPGDLFECTCGDIPRYRFFVDGLSADLDSGFTGISHDSGLADGASYILEPSGCDCDAFSMQRRCDGDRATLCASNADCVAAGAGSCTLATMACTGNSADPVCDVVGFQHPRCSFDAFGIATCDEHGNNDGEDTDSDCRICDAYNLNAGASCTNEADCQAQCFNAAGVVIGQCTKQSDCPAGAVCMGQCDRTAKCLLTTYGAPVPISSASTAVCAVTTFRADIYGTQDLVGGDHELFIRQSSRIHLGTTNTTPCPVCGGFCSSGARAGESCMGTCASDGAACRFDSDCGGAGPCTGESAQCPDSGKEKGVCNLESVCSAGPNAGRNCLPEAYTETFGTTSNDCPPSTSANISGKGLAINMTPATSGTAALADALACDAPGYQNYRCPCPSNPNGDSIARPTQPNVCASACNAGPERGRGCATGSAVNGILTKCVGGVEDGVACDEDGDCPGGTCSGNPLQCSGDPAFEAKSCTSNADCGAGLCQDACPEGRCVPLCLPSTDPLFMLGSQADPEEGLCAAGPNLFHCSGSKFSFVECDAADAVAGCDATCESAGTSCQDDSECPGGDRCIGPCQKATLCEAGTDGVLGNENDLPGAGVCIPVPHACFASPYAATCSAAAGTATTPCTTNADCPAGRTCTGPAASVAASGAADPFVSRSVAAFCMAPVGNSTINIVAGLGGPGRLRQSGVNVPNFDCLGPGCP